MATVDTEFQRDVFHLRQGIPDEAAQSMKVNDAHHLATQHVSDEEGTLLLVASTPSPSIGLLVAPIFAGSMLFPVFLVIGVFLTLLSQDAQRAFTASLFGCLAILSFLFIPVAFIWPLMRFNARNHCRIYTVHSNNPILELRPRIQHLGLVTIYELWSSREELLATLRANHVYNIFFPRRWVGTHPEGSVWFVARENSVVPNGIRVVATARGRSVLFPIPNCLILEPDNVTLLGKLKRAAPNVLEPSILDTSADRDHALDRRVAVALAVFLEFSRGPFPNSSG